MGGGGGEAEFLEFFEGSLTQMFFKVFLINIFCNYAY